MASKERPASCGRAALADGGRVRPCTRERLTPPRSKTCPSSTMQVVPPPPSARCQESRVKPLRSTTSSAETMRSCSAEK
jgi:hypothetical protein